MKKKKRVLRCEPIHNPFFITEDPSFLDGAQEAAVEVSWHLGNFSEVLKVL